VLLSLAHAFDTPCANGILADFPKSARRFSFGIDVVLLKDKGYMTYSTYATAFFPLPSLTPETCVSYLKALLHWRVISLAFLLDDV